MAVLDCASSDPDMESMVCTALDMVGDICASESGSASASGSGEEEG